MYESSKMAMVFNRTEALDRLGGDDQLLREIARLFVSEYPSLIDAIRLSVASGDAPGLERNAHALKGSVANFAAQAAVDAAFHLECLGRSGNLADAGAGLAQLELVFEELQPVLRSVAAA